MSFCYYARLIQPEALTRCLRTFYSLKDCVVDETQFTTLFQTTTIIIMVVTCICKLNVFFVCLIFMAFYLLQQQQKNNVYTRFCQCICDWSFLVIKKNTKNKNKQTIKQLKKHNNNKNQQKEFAVVLLTIV